MSVDTELLVRFKFPNVCRGEDLEDCTLEDMVRGLIEEDGLFGVVQDDYEIVEVRRVQHGLGASDKVRGDS